MLFSLLLAFSLSLDALGIGLSYGLRSIRFRPSALLLLTIEAFLMMELFLFAGRRLAAVFPTHLAERFSHASSFLRRVALSARHGARKAEGDFAPAFPLPLR